MVGHQTWIPGMDWGDCESNPYVHEVSLTDPDEGPLTTVYLTKDLAFPPTNSEYSEGISPGTGLGFLWCIGGMNTHWFMGSQL